MTRFKGVWPALVTPLTENDGVDVAATRRLLDYLVDAGVHGFYVCGGTGEGVLLSVEERKLMAETVIDHVNGRVPIIMHVGAIATASAVDLARHAERAGADAIAAVPPFYYRPDFQAIKDHYAMITGASRLPCYLYYIPSTTGITLSAEQMWELCQMPNVAGFKYSDFDLYKLEQILAMGSGTLNVFSGPDQLFLPCQAVGVDGAVGSTYNILPKLFLELYDAFCRSDMRAARELQAQGNRIIDTYVKYGGIPALREILRQMGYDCGYCRRPLGRLSSDQVASMSAELRDHGFWDLL